MEEKLEVAENKKKFFKDTKNIIIIILSILLFVTIGSSPRNSIETISSLAEKEKTIEANQKMLEDLQNSNNLLKKENQNLEDDKKLLQQENQDLENEKNKVQQEKEELEAQKSTLEQENQNLKNQVEQLKKTSSTKNSSSNTSTPKTQTSTTQNTNSAIVYITRTGEKYHKSGCSYLRQSKIQINLSDAKAQGYTPCSRCY